MYVGTSVWTTCITCMSQLTQLQEYNFSVKYRHLIGQKPKWKMARFYILIFFPVEANMLLVLGIFRITTTRSKILAYILCHSRSGNTLNGLDHIMLLYGIIYIQKLHDMIGYGYVIWMNPYMFMMLELSRDVVLKYETWIMPLTVWNMCA